MCPAVSNCISRFRLIVWGGLPCKCLHRRSQAQCDHVSVRFNYAYMHSYVHTFMLKFHKLAAFAVCLYS